MLCGKKGRFRPSFFCAVWARRILAGLSMPTLPRGKRMKILLLMPLVAISLAQSSFAQDRIYRCGNEYTNTVPSSKVSGCKLLEGGNVTVVQGTRPAAPASARVAASGAQRVDATEQKSRDADARQILEAELKKAQERQFDLQKEYNNGEPQLRADETRTSRNYLTRVSELKASLLRNESDIAGIRRELGRASATSALK